ncbi:MAG: polymer-forming cytoskeletal protein [Propionivibrio sp.]
MFNKSGVFGRNEPANSTNSINSTNPTARRDIPSGVAAAPVAVASASPSSAERLSNRGVPGVKEVQPVETTPPPVAAPAPVETAPAAGDGMGARLIVGPDVKLKGAEILDCDTLVVEGRVEATMDSRVIRIAENGSFSGKVSIDIAEIHGTFEGELTARAQLIIHSTGRVSGTIRYGKLVADEGGELCGDINVIAANAAVSAKPPSVSRDGGVMLGVVSA